MLTHNFYLGNFPYFAISFNEIINFMMEDVFFLDGRRNLLTSGYSQYNQINILSVVHIRAVMRMYHCKALAMYNYIGFCVFEA